MKTNSLLLALCLLGAQHAIAQDTVISTTTPATTYSTTSATSSSTPLGLSAENTSMRNEAANTTMRADNAVSQNAVAPTTRDKRANDYKNFVFGLYAGLNTTKFQGEATNRAGDLSGRLGYQAGFFVRGGGRLYGQLGAEYFTSSSNFFTPGSGQTVRDIQSQINIQYVQIPVYIGFKLLESDRGISAIRLQAGLAYANRINSKSGDFKLTNSEIKSGTFNAMGQLGFDIGPLLIDLTYHHGLSDAVNRTGFNGSQRRILSASVGFKF